MESTPVDGTTDESFDAFYERHALRLRDFFRRRASASEADDLLEETFVAAWRHFDKLQKDPSREIGWLFVTARNQLRNQLRARWRGVRLRDRLENAAQPDDVAAPDPVSRSDFITDDSVAEVFARLSDEDRFILTLDAWDQCTTNELAAVLGCSQNAAKTRLSRARGRFRERLEADRQRRDEGGETADERRDLPDRVASTTRPPRRHSPH